MYNLKRFRDTLDFVKAQAGVWITGRQCGH
jgi:hypothetical protein